MTNQANNSTSDFISEVNSHVEESLNDYCSLPKPLQFAILLKGSWGCGKSWFINQYIEKLKNRDKTKTPLYVSLYGVNNFSQIDEALFEQTHPQLSSKTAKIARKFFKGIFSKFLINLDVNSDQKPDGNIQPSFSELSLKDFLNTSIQDDSKYNLLVFDDLERCSIDIEDIFGYINNFVDSEYLTVVIVADEDKIYEKYENDGKYRKIKEKLIRKTFEVSPDFQAALKSFIEKLKTEQTRDFLLNNINLIKALFDEGECKNIRILNQVILDFERVFKALTEKAQNKSEFTEEILELLVIFSIEIAMGRLNPTDIIQILQKIKEEEKQLINHRININQNNSDNPELKTIQMFSKYKNIDFFNFDGSFPSLSWWSDFFNKGTVNKDVLEKEIVNSKYFQDENTPNWLKLWYYMDYSDEEFSEILNQVDSEYKDRKFEDVETIKHITGLFLVFSDAEVYGKSKSEIVKEAKKYIDELKNSNKLNFECGDNIKAYEKTGFQITLSFQGKNYQEFKVFDNYIKEYEKELRLQNMPNEANKLLDIMEKDVLKLDYFITASSNWNISGKRYFDYPIFKHLLAEDFVRKILTLTTREILYVFDALQKRYNVNGIVEKLVDELDFLKEVQELLLKQVDARKGKLSGHTLKTSSESLAIIISDLEQVKNSLPPTN